MSACTSILVVVGLVLAGPVPLAAGCGTQPSCCCPHEALADATPSAGSPSECCDTADGSPPVAPAPMARELPPRAAPAATVAEPAADVRSERIQRHAPYRPGPTLAEIHRHARLSVFLI